MSESKPLPPLPGRRKLHAEFLPVSSPPFRDHVRPPWKEKIDSWSPFEGAPAKIASTPELVRKAEHAALSNGDVRRLLDKKRYVAIGGSLRNPTGESSERQSSVLFVFYNYTDDLTVEVRLDSTGEKVQQVSQKRAQPTAVEAEVERAVQLARLNPELAKHVTPELEGNALLLKGVDAYDREAIDPTYYHRLFEVSFRHPEERAPRYQALVDLSAETVLPRLCTKLGLIRALSDGFCPTRFCWFAS